MRYVTFTLLAGILLLSSCGTSNIKTPEYRDIRDVRLIEVGLLQTKAGLNLVYYNPNKFSVQLTDATGDIYIDNNFLGRFELGEKVQVGKRSEFILPAIVKVDMIGAVKNMQELLKKKEALIRIEGNAYVRKAGISRTVPIRYESVENIERFRALITH